MHDVILGDCLVEVPRQSRQFDLVYLDPPFFTQVRQAGTTRDGERSYNYDDRWESLESYLNYIRERLIVLRESLSDKGSIIYHCDRRTSHHARLLLDQVFGIPNFRSEIIWTYKRWSNSKRGLIPGHQNLYWYSKTKDYIFNTQFKDYSASTNVDQILQSRARDERNKSVYKKDSDGSVAVNGAKPGVPLSDVWDIPYLNPKAKERVGYPTQKPIELLSRIVSIWSEPESVVLDPFCGSGTTLLAAKEKGRLAFGIDKSEEAVALTRSRLENPIITKSRLLAVGRDKYKNSDQSWRNHLGSISVTQVQRNRFIDAILSKGHEGHPVLIRVQRSGESLSALRKGLAAAARKKNAAVAFLVATDRATQQQLIAEDLTETLVRVIRSPELEIAQTLDQLG